MADAYKEDKEGRRERRRAERLSQERDDASIE